MLSWECAELRFPWFRHRFLLRRRLDRLFLDLPDAAFRRAVGRGHWPPYSLRAFVGGAQGFEDAGKWFVDEFWRLGLLARGIRILDIGCGCGRVAYGLATDARLREWDIRYTGMDVDAASVAWCQTHITPKNERFLFYHADCGNPSYNPAGAEAAGGYSFPHPGGSFDLVLLTSVFTHLLESDLRHYLAEVSRLLAPGGVAYATYFLYNSGADAAAGISRHGIPFPFVRQHHAVNRQDYPTNAVAYEESFVRRVADGLGLRVIEPVRYGVQDLIVLTKIPAEKDQAELVSGWHVLEKDGSRWTERAFTVRITPPPPGQIKLRFRFYLPEILFQPGQPVRLSATAEGVLLGIYEYESPGEYVYAADVMAASTGVPISIRFELSIAYGPSAIDERELGLLAGFASGTGPLPRRLQPFQFQPTQFGGVGAN